MRTMSGYADEFITRGVVLLPAVIHPVELAELRRATARVLSSAGQSRFGHDIKRCEVVDGEYLDGDTLCRIEYCLDKDPAFINLLGHPVILAFAAAVLCRPFLLTWEDMLIKIPMTGIAVPPHQDLKYQSTQGLVFSMGVYLDDSLVSPFQVIPGSQSLGPLEKNELARVSRMRERDYVSIPVRAGDILVHNVLALHRSPPNASANYRRTLYFEFRSVESVLMDSPWSAQWAWRRLDYAGAAARERAGSRLLRQEDVYFHERLVDRGERFWRLNERIAPVGEIDWRVSHDEVFRHRAQDEEYI